MAIYEFEGKQLKKGIGCYIFDEATIIGDVQLGDECYIGAGAVLRGDYGKIVIGNRSIVEDNCTVHARPGDECRIGNDVTIGHGAILHNCDVRDFVVVGMGAIVSDYAKVGEWAVIGEGSVVKNKQEIPAGKVAVGVPAKVIADTSEEYKKQWTEFKDLYRELARERYPKYLKKIE